MRNLISEVVLLVVAVALIVSLLMFFGRSTGEMYSDAVNFIEERRLNRLFVSLLAQKDEIELRNILKDFVLEKYREQLNWFEHKTMLSGAQREEGLTAARDALAKQEALFIAKFGAAQRELIMKILKEELAKRPLTARRNLAAKWASTQGAPPEVSNRG